MELIFNNGEKITNPTHADYSINGNIATIKGENPNTSGFYFENFGVKIADYSKYNTLYRKLDDCYELSNDGSIYIPPEPPAPPEPHEFTHTTIMLNDVEYDALDLNGLSFYLTDGEYDFSDVYEITIDGETYTDFKYVGTNDVVIDEVKYVQINFRQLSELEIQVARNTSNIDYISMETGVEL